MSGGYTKGPWVEFEDYEVSVDAESNIGNQLSGWWVIGNPEQGNGEVAALLHFHGTSSEEAEANARLIAAAPELVSETAKAADVIDDLIFALTFERVDDQHPTTISRGKDAINTLRSLLTRIEGGAA